MACLKPRLWPAILYALKPVSISRMSSADAAANRRGCTVIGHAGARPAAGFINWANTRPASSYESLPAGFFVRGHAAHRFPHPYKLLAFRGRAGAGAGERSQGKH
jgi:hypothetical protein